MFLTFLKSIILSICLAWVYRFGLYFSVLQTVNSPLSWMIHKYLLFRYPILSHNKASTQTIPTCPYQFPNGQGDVAKFLEGEKNSEAWAKEHGKVYRIWSGMTSEIVLTDPDDVRTVFKDSDAHIKGVNNDAGWLMGKLLGKCMGLVNGPEWRQTRLCIAEAFAQRSIAGAIGRVTEITREYMAELEANGRLAQQMLNPGRDLRLLPFWIMADYLYGRLSPEQHSQLEALVPLRDSLFQRVIQGGATRFSWSQYLPSTANRDLNDFKARWKQFNDVAYTACKEQGHAPPIVRMLEAYRDGSITMDNMLQTMDEMLFGNLDVTAGGLTWNPLFMAAYPGVQAQLRQELRRELGDGRKAWEAYLLRSDTLLAASILEAARLKPIAAFSIPQAAPSDRVVGGYLVPGRTNYVIDTYALNVRNPYWGKDSAEYRPSRFLERKAADTRYHYWRFGFGPRQCLGKYLADIMIRVIVARLVGGYQLNLTPTSSWDKNPSVWIAHPDTEILCEKIME